MYLLANKFVHNPSYSVFIWMNFFPFITGIDSLNSKVFLQKNRFREGASEDKNTLYNFEVEILYKLNHETHGGLSVTSVLTKNHDIAVRGTFLPSSLQNDGEQGIYLAPNSNCNNWNQGIVTHGVLQGSTRSIGRTFISRNTYRQVWWRLNAHILPHFWLNRQCFSNVESSIMYTQQLHYGEVLEPTSSRIVTYILSPWMQTVLTSLLFVYTHIYQKSLNTCNFIVN